MPESATKIGRINLKNKCWCKKISRPAIAKRLIIILFLTAVIARSVIDVTPSKPLGEDWSLYNECGKISIIRDSNHHSHLFVMWNDVFYTFFVCHCEERSDVAIPNPNFNPPQGWLLIAPARHNSNKFDSALAYSQF